MRGGRAPVDVGHVLGHDRRLHARRGGGLGVGRVHHVAERPDVVIGLVAQRCLIHVDPPGGIGQRRDADEIGRGLGRADMDHVELDRRRCVGSVSGFLHLEPGLFRRSVDGREIVEEVQLAP
jgi:hypothetical protein